MLYTPICDLIDKEKRRIGSRGNGVLTKDGNWRRQRLKISKKNDILRKYEYIKRPRFGDELLRNRYLTRLR